MQKEILSSQELSRLQVFINDPVMKEAVRKVLTYQIYYAGTIKPDAPIEKENFAFACIRGADGADRSNEEIGKRLHTIAEATGMVEKAFKDIDSLKEVKEEKKEKINQAR